MSLPPCSFTGFHVEEEVFLLSRLLSAMTTEPQPPIKRNDIAVTTTQHLSSKSSPIELREKFSPSTGYSPTLSNDIKADYPEVREGNAWRPSFFRTRPLLGLAAVGLAVACSLIALAVLFVSNGQPITTWTLQPTVYLAITTALSNSALAYALLQAILISWWYKVSRGSTIRELELDWETGQSFSRGLGRGLIYGRRIALITVASIAVAIVIIDGPLLQRASSVEISTVIDTVEMTTPLSPELPTGFSGTLYPGNSYDSWAAHVTSKAYLDGRPMTISTNCEGICKTKVGLFPAGFRAFEVKKLTNHMRRSEDLA